MPTIKSKAKQLYLDCTLVKPGDILVTGERTLISRVICAATWSRVSHAALIVSMTARFEADGNGIGFTMMPYERVEKSNSLHSARFLHALPSGTHTAVLLRHSDFGFSDTDLIGFIHSMKKPILWTQYPPLERLASVFKNKPLKHQVLAGVLAWVDRRKAKPHTNPGPFCSQLVAGIYSSLNCELIQGVPPRKKCLQAQSTPLGDARGPGNSTPLRMRSQLLIPLPTLMMPRGHI
jgi:hypothetical protein